MLKEFTKKLLNKSRIFLFILIGIIIGLVIAWLNNHINNFPYIFSDTGLPIISVDGTYIVKDQNGIELSGKYDPSGVNGHTVHIDCYKDTMTCREQQAYIGLLTHSIVIGNMNEFGINEWTNERIVSKALQIDRCTNEVLKIDREAKSVIIINSLNPKDGECAKLPDKIITLQIK